MAEGFLTGDATGTTWVKRLGGNWEEVVYTAVDGLAVFEGCIILGTVAEAEAVKQFVINNPGIKKPGTQSFGTGIVGTQFRWENDTIPFEIDPTLPNQQRVHDAIKHWETNTPIRFVPRTAAHDNFVVFRPGNGCASSVGCRGGRQDIILGSACTTGNCIHEIGHTVGLWHEQSRTDRDQFITIKFNEILQNARHNFDKHVEDGIDLGAYDYGSIMHYPRDAFTATGEDTIIPTDPNAEIGQRKKLSDGDIKAVKKLITI